MVDIAFEFAGAFRGVVDQFNILSNPTSLDFGPDGRLYVTVQTGSIHAFTVEERDGEWVAINYELVVDENGAEAVRNIQNHFDDGSEKSAGDRQVTGIVVAGTETEPVLYVSSSDPSISNNGELNLDTNSGVLSKVSFNATTGNWDVVDLVRGLPRSEENHAVNGMTLSEDGTSLLLQVGGNTNNGAPSNFFSYTAEYALSAAVLEIDLAALDAMPIQIDPQGGQGNAPRAYVYDLPTLDDPNIENVTDGVGEDANGMDESGPWGGNDGLNMAILPADAPLRIYADGLRNAYDLAETPNGNIFSVDNGSNGGIGNVAAVETPDNDGDGISGEAINTPINGGFGEGEPLVRIVEGGYYYHGNSVRSNQNQSWTVYDDEGDPDVNVAVNFVPDISALVPDGVDIPDGFLIDPSRFAYAPGLSLADVSQQELEDRLFLSGVTIDSDLLEQNDPDGAGQGQQAIAILGSSTNGIVSYNSGGQAFNGVLDGALFVAQFNDNVTLLNINDEGTALDPIMSSGPDGIFGTADDEVQDADGVLFVANNSLGVPLGNPLDVTVGPNGTLWVAEIGGNDVTILAPTVTGPVSNTDSDNDGIENENDPFIRDASNGTGVTVLPGQTLLWDFDANQDGNLPGADGFGGGLTGVMIDDVTDFEAFLQSPSSVPGQNIQLDNVKFITAAGGGTTIVENVSNGDPFETSNNGEFLFHTGLVAAPNVDTMNISWVIGNPGDALTGDGQQIGAYIGTGDQSNYLKLVAVAGRSEGEFYMVLELGDTAQEFYFQADDLFNVAEIDGKDIIIDLDIDLGSGIATPTFTYQTDTGPDQVVAATAIDLSGSVILDALKGDYTVEGQPSGLAVGLFSSNVGQSAQDTFQAIFKDIEVTASGEASETLYRVNAGGPLVAATDDGPDWLADTSGTPSTFLVEAGTNLTAGGNVTPGATVPADAPAALFATERFDFSFDPAMEYAFDVTPGGTYEVRLYMGNSFVGTSDPGDRVFDVAIEGDVLPNLDDIDLSDQFGHTVGGVISNTVTVTDGELNIAFLHGVENPLINAIEIVSVGDGGGGGPYVPPDDTLFGASVEISDDRLNPTFGGVLQDGNNFVTATQEGETGENGVRDRDYFTFTVPEDKVLTGIFLDDYENDNTTSPDGFLAIQEGTQITVDPVTGQPDAGTDPLLGALIYGFGTSGGENLLETMADGGLVDPSTGFTLPGFTQPLTGDLSVWLNQGAGPGTPTLRFEVDDAPGTEPDPDPTTTEGILASLTDVDDDGAYSASDTGSALLTILDGNDNPQTSNFGTDSFQLTNSGDKEIAAVAIDFRTAVFSDSVVDIDGSAGDTSPKVFNIDTNGGTGGFVTQSDAYLFAGDDPLPNTTGTGLASTGGFQGVLIKFDGTGFTNGETVGFSGDMDSNSIAGLNKFGADGVDTGAINSWDVGGVSGSELIGSTFTVLFDDGSTATGHLHSDNSQSGSIGEAVENQAQSVATLSIETDGETLGSGDLGTYGGAAPVITVTGTPGDTVRVVLQKGLNPVTNDTNGIATLVADRLADSQPDFLANNSFDLQTVDVVIPAGGSITLPASAFDYNDTVSFETFIDNDLQPLAFTAAVIAPASDNAPDVLQGDENVALGPVSAPIYLANNGLAVGDSAAASTLVLQSGTVTTDQTDATSSTRVDFDQTMIDPVVVMGPLSDNDSDPATLRILDIDEGGFEFLIDEYDYQDGVHGTESMSWVAVERGVHVTPDGAVIEAGTASVGNAAQTVGFAGAFGSDDVAVVAQATTANEASAVTDRISNVDENGFVIRLQEEEGADGQHALEDVDWVAVSAGDFIDYEASVLVNALDENNDTFSFLSRDTNEAFLADMQSFNGGDTSGLRHSELSALDVMMRVEEEQSLNAEVNHTFESLAVLSFNDFVFI